MATSTPALTRQQIEALEPDYIGPTWRHKAGCHGRLEDHPGCEWDLPELTLGWQVAAWCAEYLNGPNGGRWTFTPEQLRFVLWWFAVDDAGVFVYRTGVMQRLKGHGKDPLAAVLCLVELLGPSRLDHFDPAADGGCVGRRHPDAWVQVAAVSRDQTRTTMAMFPILMSRKLIDTYGIRAGAEIIRAYSGRVRIEAVTRSYRALEGGRSTFIILNETHHWIRGNNGDLMFETIDGNATKMDGRYVAITNAFLPGEDSVAEKMRLAFELIDAGRAPEVGFMYDSVEAHPSTPLTEEALRIVLPKIRGDARWLNIDAIVKSILSLTIPAARSRRMWLNQIVSDEDSLYTLADFRAIEVDAELEPGDDIVLGFDGGRFEDSTALVAIRVSDRVSFLVRLWQKPRDALEERWQVDPTEVDSTVREMFALFHVKAFFADVALWESYIIEWSRDYGPGLVVHNTERSPIGWDMRGSEQANTRAHESFLGAIKDATLRYCRDDIDLRRHALNARTVTNKYGTYFRSESHDSVRKVDAYAAWMLAHEALRRLLTNPRPEKIRTSRGWFL